MYVPEQEERKLRAATHMYTHTIGSGSACRGTIWGELEPHLPLPHYVVSQHLYVVIPAGLSDPVAPTYGLTSAS